MTTNAAAVLFGAPRWIEGPLLTNVVRRGDPANQTRYGGCSAAAGALRAYAVGVDGEPEELYKYLSEPAHPLALTAPGWAAAWEGNCEGTQYRGFLSSDSNYSDFFAIGFPRDGSHPRNFHAARHAQRGELMDYRKEGSHGWNISKMIDGYQRQEYDQTFVALLWGARKMTQCDMA